ncbi:Na+/H+ antiporter subunit E [Alkalilimnicola ehrlichii]|uniref:Na+/H+ antiporter subunit E n=1 Tax=Alkalilimnicola ehrlichii TaxID=351052 RepID=A0A3E0X0J9_9GAMM|nr:Na+/H+ antiporter subunit E [Alkalilimnicola ehrlichii]RFA30361.1 Na+/H+ antiporter subunit E [Alkalilimnicola ehrlichii]RFA37933.1 Na+/H+ antiporter subunit E [Alkalilimnicola ehrlichii]
MIAFASNLVLAITWVVLTGTFTAVNLVAGFVLAYVVLRLTKRGSPQFDRYFSKTPKFIGFIFFFIWDLLKSNLRVAYDVITPSHHMRPGVIGVPLDAETDAEITILANLITVTPGTLSLDVSGDRKTLYIHAMYIDNEEELRKDIKNLERRVIELLR